MSLVIYLTLSVLQGTGRHSITNVTTFNKNKIKCNIAVEACLKEVQEPTDNVAPPVFLTGIVSALCNPQEGLRQFVTEKNETGSGEQQHRFLYEAKVPGFHT